MKITKQEVVEKYVRVCDLCKEIETHRICVGCGIDVCRECGVWWDIDPWTGVDLGDYWDRVCPECNEKAESVLGEVRKINAEHEENIERLKEQWKASCAR